SATSASVATAMLRWNLIAATHSAIANAGIQYSSALLLMPSACCRPAFTGSPLARGRRRNVFSTLCITSHASQLQQLPGVLIVDLVLLLRRQAELVDEIDAFPLEHEQRRRVSPEEEMINPDRVNGAARTRRMIAGRLEIHHLQIMQRLVLDHHRLARPPPT